MLNIIFEYYMIYKNNRLILSRYCHEYVNKIQYNNNFY